MISVKEKLQRSLAAGNQLKTLHVLGKEHYALYINGEGHDEVVSFIDAKCELFEPKLAGNISAVQVFWSLYKVQPSMFRHDPITSVFFIHKRKFKRYLKKAMMRSQFNA